MKRPGVSAAALGQLAVLLVALIAALVLRSQCGPATIELFRAIDTVPDLGP